MLKELGRKVGTSYEYKDVYSIPGRLTQSLSSRLLDSINKRVSKGKHIIEVFESLGKSCGIELQKEYDPSFLSLLNEKGIENSSFIFYGDHSKLLEPFLFALSFPEKLRKYILRNDRSNEDSVLKVIGTDMVLISLPSLARHIIPVIVRDSYLQEITCQREFLESRRSARERLNSDAIKISSSFLSIPGNNLLVYPQGAGKDKRWKSGIIRILVDMARKSPDRVGKTLLVPVSCIGLKKRHMIRLILNSKLRKFGVKPKIRFRVVYGKPTKISELLADLPKSEMDIETAKKYMKSKVEYLERTYEAWAGKVEPGFAKASTGSKIEEI